MAAVAVAGCLLGLTYYANPYDACAMVSASCAGDRQVGWCGHLHDPAAAERAKLSTVTEFSYPR